jgi:serine/threonine protein kinase/Tol biopolymer transport system component
VTVSSGARLGPYEVIAPVGAGGMGEVWRARDTRLQREVAIKVLPAEMASDGERLKRFEKEARSASSLNHPSIVTIYEIGQEGATSYIAMELVEGKTLRELVAGGPLPIKKLLQIGAQVAEGLARAHEAGIVHRDLKPENVMVTKDGLAKILDFGLAKLTYAGPGSGNETDLPTQTATTPGVVMGTVGYMSPEQASGHPVDFRSDQFSFGSLLYEMATGKRAFQRKTAVQTLAAIIQEEPEPVGSHNPGPLRWIIERCLAKEPGDRYASTRDLARELATLRDRLSEVSLSGAVLAAEPALPGLRARRFVLALALLAALAIGVLAGRLSKGLSSSAPRFRQVTFGNFTISKARFAPDGQTVVYSAIRSSGADLLTARAGTPEFRSLGIPDAEIHSISPQGEMAITLDRKDSLPTLARAALAGGAPREILEDTVGASWAPDGKSLAVVHVVEGKFRLEFPIGKVLYETKTRINSPLVSPSGDRVAFREAGSVSIVDREGRKETLPNGKGSLDFLWAPSGRELWFGESEEGSTQVGAVTLEGRERLMVSLPGDFALQDVSRDGRLLVERGFERWRVTGSFRGDSRERDLTFLDATIPADISADGSTLLFSEKQPGWKHASIYERKTDGSPAVRLGEGFAMALSPDGKWVLALPENPASRLLLVPTGAGETRPLANEEGLTIPGGSGAGWLPDGKSVVFSAAAPEHQVRLYLQEVAGGKPRPVSPEGVRLLPFPSWISPDGKSVIGSGPSLALYSLEGKPPSALPLADGDVPIRWTADGKGLFVYHDGDSPVRVSLLELSTGRKRPWKEFDACSRSGANFFSILLTPDGTSQVVACQQWLSNLYIMEGLR